jgi:hypothetical protein
VHRAPCGPGQGKKKEPAGTDSFDFLCELRGGGQDKPDGNSALKILHFSGCVPRETMCSQVVGPASPRRCSATMAANSGQPAIWSAWGRAFTVSLLLRPSCLDRSESRVLRSRDCQFRCRLFAELEPATEFRSSRCNNLHNCVDLNDFAGGGRSDLSDSVAGAVPKRDEVTDSGLRSWALVRAFHTSSTPWSMNRPLLRLTAKS